MARDVLDEMRMAGIVRMPGALLRRQRGISRKGALRVAMRQRRLLNTPFNAFLCTCSVGILLDWRV